MLALTLALVQGPAISAWQATPETELEWADADLRDGQYRQAARRYRSVLRALHAEPKHALLLPALTGLSVALLRSSQLQEAEIIARSALSECHTSEVAFPSCRVYALNNLGSILTQRGRSVEGEALLQEAATQAFRLPGPEHAVTAEVFGNLGGSLAARGELARAEPVLRKSLWISERAKPRNEPAIAMAHVKLGWLYLAEKRLHLAEEQLEEAQRMWRLFAKPDHPGMLPLLDSLVQLRFMQRRYQEAESLLAVAQSILATMPADSATPERVTLLTSGAMLAFRRRDSDSALAHLSSAIVLQLRVLPANDPALLKSVHRYAAILRADKRGGALRRIEAWTRMLQQYPAGRQFVAKCPPGNGDCCGYYLNRAE